MKLDLENLPTTHHYNARLQVCNMINIWPPSNASIDFGLALDPKTRCRADVSTSERYLQDERTYFKDSYDAIDDFFDVDHSQCCM